MKGTCIVSAVVCVLLLAGTSCAQECGMGPAMQGGQMMVPGGMQGGQMGGGMMQRPSASMVSSSDGGVIVLLGSKLYKYDKDLKLIKEVELKTEQKQSQKK